MNRFGAVVFVALCPALFGQEKPLPITKLVHLQYVSAEAVANLIKPGPRPAFAVANNGLRAVLLKGTSEGVASAEQLVRQMDVPSARDSERDIETVVYVIGASAKTQSQAPEPRDLEPVIRQLQSVFPYANYQLLDSMVLRSREGQHVGTKGIMRDFPGAGNSLPNNYGIGYGATSSSSAGKTTIRFENFSFETGAVVGSVHYPVDFNTDLDVQPGQKVVVGKTNIDGGESALFVVLTAKLLE